MFETQRFIMKKNFLLFIFSLIVCAIGSNKAYAQCYAGEISMAQQFVCAGETYGTQVINNDPVCGVGTYYLHSSLPLSTSNVLATSGNGFFGTVPAGVSSNQIYYISYAQGPADAAGNADLNDPGTGLAIGGPFEVIFLEAFDIVANGTCDPLTGVTTYEITVTGGFASFDPQTLLDINTAYGSFDDVPAGVPVTIQVPPNSAVFPIVCSDLKGCEGTLIVEPIDCICESTAGDMPTGTTFACPGETVGAQSTGFYLEAGDVVCYVLHSGNGNSLGTVYDVNSTGIFAQPAGLDNNVAAYISAVVGPPTSSGCPDLSDPCDVAAGAEVVFLDPISIEVTFECAGDPVNDPTYIAIVTVNGGSPGFNNNQLYNLSGSVNGTIETGTATEYGPFAEGTPFQISATDSKGCTDSFFGNPPMCGCGNAPGIMVPANIVACAGSQATATQSGSVLAPGDVVCYALHDSPTSTPGTIYGVNSTGTFTDQGLECTTLYISAIIGQSDGAGCVDLTDICTIVLPGTPVTWVPAVQINTVESCDQTTGTYSVAYTISGGYPECNSGGTYNVSCDDNQVGIPGGTYTFGEFGDGDTYCLEVSDQFGCSSTFNSPPVQCTKLPISLLSLDGEAIQSGNLIKWETASEIVNDYFTVYSSTNGVDFQEIATIAGNGTTSEAKAYEYLDKNALSGLTIYKLTQTDYDGTVNEVGIVEILRGENTTLNINTINPMPVISEMEVMFSATEGESTIVIYDMVGRIVKEFTIVSISGNNVLDLNVADINSGVYFLSITNNNDVTTTKFVKD